MKRIRCPKCDEAVLFDETRYEAGRILVFECPACHKQFKLRLPSRSSEGSDAAPTESPAVGHLVVVENVFHFKQTIPLHEGENVVGRWVKGTKANAAIKTVDPSMDTTHCIITVTRTPAGDFRFVLRDAPSHTGTFLQSEILNDHDRAIIREGDIITIGATTLILREGEDD